MFFFRKLREFKQEGLVDNFSGPSNVKGVLNQSLRVEDWEEETNKIAILVTDFVNIHTCIGNLRDKSFKFFGFTVKLVHHLVESSFVHIRSLPDLLVETHRSKSLFQENSASLLKIIVESVYISLLLASEGSDADQYTLVV